MQDNIEVNKETRESLMRKQYREYYEEYKEYVNLYKNKYDELNEKYLVPLRKVNIWKKRFFLNIWIFSIAFLFIAFILYITDLFVASAQFFLILSLVSLLINSLVYLFLCLTNKTMKKEIEKQQEGLKKDYYDFAVLKLQKASALVIDLMIEEEKGEEAIKYKENHTEEEYKKYMFALRRYYAYHIKDQYKAITPNTIVNFYNEWHSLRNGEGGRVVSHEERLALAYAKSRLYNNN